MATYSKLNGLISLATNSPGAPTGYGTQAKYLVDRLVRHGMKTAILSNYGLEGSIQDYKTPYGKAAHYPKGWVPHSVDVMELWHEHHRAKHSELPHALLTLYDVWVYHQLKFQGPILSWVPIDHATIPPMVAAFLRRENVHPISMSPHGNRELDALDIENTYIPHAVDMSIFKPTKRSSQLDIRQSLKVSDETFLVTMVANNKGNQAVHRKGMAENIAAFAAFHQKHPYSHLHLHTDPRPVLGGFDLGALTRSLGLDNDTVSFADPDELMVGYPQKTLAALYTASDVLLAASYGEGFGVPIIEAQACGTKVITSNWTATQDLAGPSSYLVAGQPWWNNLQSAWWNIPNLGSLVNALEQAFEAWEGPMIDEPSIEFAKQFEVEHVWAKYWLPFLTKRFA